MGSRRKRRANAGRFDVPAMVPATGSLEGLPTNTETGPTAFSRVSVTEIQPSVFGGFGVTCSAVFTERYPKVTSILFTPLLPPARISAVRTLPPRLTG